MEGSSAEVTQHPMPEASKVETKSSAGEAEEVLSKMPPWEKASKSLGAAKGLIKGKIDQGDFDGDDKKVIRENAENALKYTGEKGDPENSNNLRAIFETLDVAGADGKKISQFASENMLINVNDGKNARMLTLNEWRAELEAAQKPADGSPPDPKRLKELEQGVFAYSFPKTTEENPESASVPKEKSPEDIVIAKYRKSLEEEFEKAGARGDVPKEQIEKIEEAVVLLRLAEKASGDAGVILKHLALKNLQDEHGAQGLEDTISVLSEQVEPAIEKVCGLMDQDKADEFHNAIKEGKLEEMIKQGKLFKVEGMRETLFGKDLTEENLKEILALDKKKKWKDPLLLALVIMLMGTVVVGQETIKLPS